MREIKQVRDESERKCCTFRSKTTMHKNKKETRIVRKFVSECNSHISFHTAPDWYGIMKVGSAPTNSSLKNLFRNLLTSARKKIIKLLFTSIALPGIHWVPKAEWSQVGQHSESHFYGPKKKRRFKNLLVNDTANRKPKKKSNIQAKRKETKKRRRRGKILRTWTNGDSSENVERERFQLRHWRKKIFVDRDISGLRAPQVKLWSPNRQCQW